MSEWMTRTNAQDENVMCANCYMKNHYTLMIWIDAHDEYLCNECFLTEESEND
jgi:hypothetical protein